jgi:hypothetical protein
MSSPEEFLNGYIGAMTLVANKEAQSPTTKFDYEYKKLPLFGITGKEYMDILNQQVNGYTYEEARRYQLLELNDVKFADLDAQPIGATMNVEGNWKNAKTEEKELMYQSYITKEIMKERLASKNFLWKFIFRGETRQMKNYIKNVEERLAKVGFDDEAKAEAAKFAKRGNATVDFFQKGKALPVDKEKTIDEALAKAIAEREATKIKKYFKLSNENKINLETDKVQKEVNAANSKEDFVERFFEIRFRPSFDKEEYQKQREEWKSIKERFTGASNQLKIVFQENTKKIIAMGDYFKAIENANEKEIQTKQNEFTVRFIQQENMVKNEVGKDYAPITGLELDNIYLAGQLAREFDNGAKKDVEKPVKPAETLDKKKDIVK